MAQKQTATLTEVRVVTADPVQQAATEVLTLEGLLDSSAVPPMPAWYSSTKRGLDVVASAAALVALSPLLLTTAAIIKFTSEGPVFFTQQRVGEGGRAFTMYKFRSMYVDSDHSLHQLAYLHFVQGNGGNGKVSADTLRLAAHDDASEQIYGRRARAKAQANRFLARVRRLFESEDPRITPFGAFIRATSIDELPQLLNVLIGHMTLVGPRPPIPYEVRLYQPKHFKRLLVRPGLTGIWQVYGRNRVPFEQMVDMDIEYIETRSLALDLKLIVQTIPALIAARAK